MAPSSDQLSFPQFRRSGIAELSALLRESKFDLAVKNSLKGAVKERVNLLQTCEIRAKKQLQFMTLLAMSEDDPKAAQSAFTRLSAAQFYIDAVFDSFRDRLHLLRRRVLVTNWKLKCDLVDRLDAGEPTESLRVELRECYRKAIVGTSPGAAKSSIRVDGFQAEFDRTVKAWVRREISEIDCQLKELR